MQDILNTLRQLSDNSNYRHLPEDSSHSSTIDLSSNDYLGIGVDKDLRQQFLETLTPESFIPTSSASRLLSAHQNSYNRLESLLSHLYRRPALLFNSGYHANTGLVSALGGHSTLFLADRLVHASIIDGLKLSGSKFQRFRHNDYDHLEQLISRYARDYSRVVIISESVFSMDGDRSDITRLVEAKRLHPDTLLYIDEAHGVGVCGPQGLGCTAESNLINEVDIIVGTFGKALASSGAFAILSNDLREFMINRSRSLIFSTSLPPAIIDWTYLTVTRSLDMDAERNHLKELSQTLASILNQTSGQPVIASHIQPLIIGNSAKTIALSALLLKHGIKVLPIRTPTVPPGTERLRFSLSASLSTQDLYPIADILKSSELTRC
ncbi:MAG: 8-amino-7-oxononanoate synthase [Muribaculaceae bacterium]|nr:8-amino-7-oxononanoate synthase [Muribaculaceae bacterium]